MDLYLHFLTRIHWYGAWLSTGESNFRFQRTILLYLNYALQNGLQGVVVGTTTSYSVGPEFSLGPETSLS